MPDDPRFEIENNETVMKLRALASLIADVNEEGWGFALFLFSHNGPEFFWISDSDRKDMIKALKEFIQREQPN